MEYVENLYPDSGIRGGVQWGRYPPTLKDTGGNESQDVSVDLDGEALRGCWGMPHVEGLPQKDF